MHFKRCGARRVCQAGEPLLPICSYYRQGPAMNMPANVSQAALESATLLRSAAALASEWTCFISGFSLNKSLQPAFKSCLPIEPTSLPESIKDTSKTNHWGIKGFLAGMLEDNRCYAQVSDMQTDLLLWRCPILWQLQGQLTKQDCWLHP